MDGVTLIRLEEALEKLFLREGERELIFEMHSLLSRVVLKCHDYE
jgi:hypothetical protein